jgi:hypothetical protein
VRTDHVARLPALTRVADFLKLTWVWHGDNRLLTPPPNASAGANHKPANDEWMCVAQRVSQKAPWRYGEMTFHEFGREDGGMFASSANKSSGAGH